MLRDFKEVAELDSQIMNLQNELVNLYRKRAQVVNTGESADGPAKSSTTLLYEELMATWDVYGIHLPSYRTLKTRLLKAEKLITELEEADARLVGDMRVVLVPPTGTVNLENLRVLRDRQSFIRHKDFLSSEFGEVEQHKSWRVMVAFAAAEGLDFGPAKDILKNKLYKIAGHDMRGLGLQEYIALTLQMHGPIDTLGWTLLLQGTEQDTDQVSSVTFIHGQYRFDTDDVHGQLSEETFRPAIEINTGKR